MDAYVILGQPWLFDMDVTLWGKVQHLYLQPWKATDQTNPKSIKIQIRERVSGHKKGEESQFNQP